MVCLAQRAHEDGLVPSRTLAEGALVPPAYISKVLQRLEGAGLVLARKGRSGGYRLARQPGAILLAEILSALDEPAVDLKACVFGWDVCSDAKPCALHHTWSEIRCDVQRWAGHTLQDVLDLQADGTANVTSRRPAR